MELIEVELLELQHGTRYIFKHNAFGLIEGTYINYTYDYTKPYNHFLVDFDAFDDSTISLFHISKIYRISE